MSAVELREITIKSRNEKRAKLEPVFNSMLEECRAAAKDCRCVQPFPGTLDPLIVQMLTERGFKVHTYNPNRHMCSQCAVVCGMYELNLGGAAACDNCLKLIVTDVMWGNSNGGKGVTVDGGDE